MSELQRLSCWGRNRTRPEPGLQLGDFVHIEGPTRQEAEAAVEQSESASTEVGPDELPERGRGQAVEEQLEGPVEGEGVARAGDEQQRGEGEGEPMPKEVHRFTGTMPLALPPERGQRLDRLDLEVQIRPQSPNGMVLYAASSPASSKDKQQVQQHSLELQNGQPKYSFRLGGETHEILLDGIKVPLGQWTTLRILNDGQGRAFLRVNSSPPGELFYTPPRPPPASSAPPGPVRIFLGGVDPARVRQLPESANFIGSIGRVRLNQREMDLAGAERAEGREKPAEEGEEEASSHLQQEENQCGKEPCLNGGECGMARHGGFQCQCRPGFDGPICQFPSGDGICPEDGRRWCHRGICLLQTVQNEQRAQPVCLCPPGWKGLRCGQAQEEEGEEEGIRFDGRHSFLAALPLGEGREKEGEEAVGKGFSVEFSLSPGQGGHTEQLVALLISPESAKTAAAVLGLQAGRLWALEQEGQLPASKRFLSKRVKTKKRQRIRLEQVGPNEVRLLVGDKPKGTLRGPSIDSSTILLLGGMPPRGIGSLAQSVEEHLAGIGHFEGCLEGLVVNGERVGWQGLAKMRAANLGTCRGKSVESEGREEEPPPTPTSAIPTQIPFQMTSHFPVVSVSEDPLLAKQEEGAWDQALMGPEGEAIDGEWAEGQKWEPIQLTGTISPDPLPSSTDRPPAPSPAKMPVSDEQKEEEEEEGEDQAETAVDELLPSATEVPETEEPDVEEPEEPTTEMPSTETPLEEEEEREEEPTTLMPAPARPTPMIGPEEELEEGPFPGLCDEKTCGAHGTCEELNASHVMCACRDYWVGQTCELFRPIEYAASFDGSAFVVFSSDELPHLISDREEFIQFKLRTRARYGLIFWQGQQPSYEAEDIEEEDLSAEDFLSIGLLDGHLAFSYELGGGAAQIVSREPVNDGRPHLIRAIRKGRNGSLQIDDGPTVQGRSSGILAMLNVEGHIFVGGVPDLHLMTSGIHTQNFVGCLAELGLNGHRIDLMGSAIDGRNVRPCREWRPQRMKRRRQWLRLLRRQRMRKEVSGGSSRREELGST